MNALHPVSKVFNARLTKSWNGTSATWKTHKCAQKSITKMVKKMNPRLRELAALARGSKDTWSRNLASNFLPTRHNYNNAEVLYNMERSQLCHAVQYSSVAVTPWGLPKVSLEPKIFSIGMSFTLTTVRPLCPKSNMNDVRKKRRLRLILRSFFWCVYKINCRGGERNPERGGTDFKITYIEYKEHA